MNSMSAGLQELAGLPQFADLPELRNNDFPTFQPAMELAAIAQNYVRVGVPIWVEACKRFEKEVAQRKEQGQAVDSAADSLELWNTVLDRTLMEFNRSSEFADLQQRYLRAGIKQKLETRRYFEMLAKMTEYRRRARKWTTSIGACTTCSARSRLCARRAPGRLPNERPPDRPRPPPSALDAGAKADQ